MKPLGKPIAAGRTALIYPWGDDQVLKLFYDWFPLQAIEHEARAARAVHAAGIASPAVGELIEVEGRKGLEYERLDGISMLQELLKHPRKASRLGMQFAELQASMHRIRSGEPPSRRKRLIGKIRGAAALPQNLKEAALSALDGMPEDNCLCHGDFHPGNVMMTSHGPVVIDWIDVVIGHPLADCARSIILLRNSGCHAGILGWLVRAIFQGFHQAYVNTYFQLMPGSQEQLDRWLPIIAAARLDENIRVEEKALLAVVRQGFAGVAKS